EDRRYMGWRTGYRVLPYRLQDGYNREKRPRAFHAVVLENEFLRAMLLPELGGRLVSLLHKPTGRELVECNPVFQPANLALRNAWFSGGIEWNTSHFGHYYLTCSPVFAARLTGVHGEPALRLYEWDRVKCFPWQVDLHLPPGSPFLFARVRLVNPHDHEIPMYWWTNVAVAEAPGVRTLCPGDTALHGTALGIRLLQLPFLDSSPGAAHERPGSDITYATNLQKSQECFFRMADGQRRWIASLDEKGSGLVQASTAGLRGRKMFCWGMHQGGRRWQEFLAAPGRAYLEIQAGLARTQLECLPMPAHAHWTWTEAFGLLEADARRVHSANWSEAWRAADAALNAILPQEQLDARDRELAAVTTRRPDEILALGAGWGALERRRLAVRNEPDRIPPELVFENLGKDQEPWLALLEKGALPERCPGEDPGQMMVQPEWRELLERSVGRSSGPPGDQPARSTCAGGDHWLAWLHLGTMRMEAFDHQGAREAWERSLQHRNNGWALRNLAVLEGADDDNRSGPQDVPPPPSQAACELMRKAWEAGPRIAALAIEYARFLLRAGAYGQLREFARGLPEHLRMNERIRLLAARAALESGDLAGVESVFDHDFATVREGEVALTDLWFAFHERRLAAAEHVPLDDALRRRVRREFPPPQRIDFRPALEIE
ncbi:MAG: DUF5107 domain-containing protein, partial [Planctomycetota bacterium]|nr:DUF5107 domain-containing protein [Planctomycetota bacterium]